MLKNARVPVVQMMELLSEPLDMNVGFSHHQAGYAMAEQIIAAGYQRVGFVGARMDKRVQQRLAGFRQALEERRSEEHTSELQSRGHLVCRHQLATKNE